LSEKPCRDCWSDLTEGAITKLPKRRVVPDSGGRCRTHWRAETLRRKARNHEKRVQQTYGLGPGEYAQLYEFQGGFCALCRRATGASRKLSVDHDHADGQVRGLLCRPCNTLLGHARDKTMFFVRCIWYLRYPPYRRMKDGADFSE
jgi:hypothetical protein